MADKVRVRPGWRKAPDGSTPRLGVTDARGREYPGNYLFHDVKNPGPDLDALGAPLRGVEMTQFVFVDREEEVYISPTVKQWIREGYLTVSDSSHKFYAANAPEPGNNTNKKTKAKSVKADDAKKD